MSGRARLVVALRYCVLAILGIMLTSARGGAQSPVYTDSPDVCITDFHSGIYQAEPSVFVDPNQPNRILVTSNTFSAPNYNNAWVSPCVSQNGGLTWECQPDAIITGARGDPASAITTQGRMYAMFIDLDQFPSRYQGLAVSMSGAPNEWVKAPQPATLQTEGDSHDKGHLWVDNSLSPPRLYAAWTCAPCNTTEGVVWFSRALEGQSLAWTSEQMLTDVVGRGNEQRDFAVHLQSAPSNRVLACWEKGPLGQVSTDLGFARSLNNGTSWPVKKYITEVNDGGVLKALQVRSAGSLPYLSPTIAVNATANETYLVWTNRGNPVGADGDPSIWIIKSPDYGDTWYGPVRVNQDTGGASQWDPWLSFDVETQSLVVLYYDSRNDATAAEVYASVSRDAGASWTDVRISDGGPGIPPIPSYSADLIGTGNEYVALMTRGGLAHAVWSDDRDRTPTQPPAFSAGGRPLKLYSSPLFLGGISASSVGQTNVRYCESGQATLELTASWQTLVGTDTARIDLHPPGADCAAPPTYSLEETSTGTSHAVTITVPCQTGLWHYSVTSKKGQGVSKVQCIEVQIDICPSCGGGCHPPCEWD